MPRKEIYQQNKSKYREQQLAYFHRHKQDIYDYRNSIKHLPKVKLQIYNANQRYRLNRIKLIAYYKDKPCADCQMFYPYYVMHFDHRDPSKKSFTIGNKTEINKKKLIEEIKKCDVVCANCHSERTHKQIVARINHHKSFKLQIQ